MGGTRDAEERAEEASQSNTEKGEKGSVFEAGFNTGTTPVP